MSICDRITATRVNVGITKSTGKSVTPLGSASLLLLKFSFPRCNIFLIFQFFLLFSFCFLSWMSPRLAMLMWQVGDINMPFRTASHSPEMYATRIEHSRSCRGSTHRGLIQLLLEKHVRGEMFSKNNIKRSVSASLVHFRYVKTTV